jgi:hypothetical protein
LKMPYLFKTGWVRIKAGYWILSRIFKKTVDWHRKTSTNRFFLDKRNHLYFYWIFGYMDIHLTNANQLVQKYIAYKPCTSALMPYFAFVIITFLWVQVQMPHVN